jgi:ferredoxin
MPQVFIKNRDTTIEISSGHSLLNNFLMQQVPIQTKCGGKAMCGRCRIKVIKGQEGLTPVRDPERLRLGTKLLAENWRLACQNHALRDITIEIPDIHEDLSGTTLGP